MLMRTLILAVGLVALTGCASTTRGSWNCKAIEGGVPCASISEIDSGMAQARAQAQAARPGRLTGAAAQVSTAPMTAQTPQGSPFRENDPVMKVNIAAFVDQVGDYHGPSQVYAVMRRGQWWQPRALPTVQLDGPAPATPVATAPAQAADPQPQP